MTVSLDSQGYRSVFVRCQRVHGYSSRKVSAVGRAHEGIWSIAADPTATCESLLSKKMLDAEPQ